MSLPSEHNLVIYHKRVGVNQLVTVRLHDLTTIDECKAALVHLEGRKAVMAPATHHKAKSAVIERLRLIRDTASKASTDVIRDILATVHQIDPKAFDQAVVSLLPKYPNLLRLAPKVS